MWEMAGTDLDACYAPARALRPAPPHHTAGSQSNPLVRAQVLGPLERKARPLPQGTWSLQEEAGSQQAEGQADMQRHS